MERLQEEIADIRRARNALPDDLQFAVLCNRSMERLREYVDVMARARAPQRTAAGCSQPLPTRQAERSRLDSTVFISSSVHGSCK
jgi:hypothetical protein